MEKNKPIISKQQDRKNKRKKIALNSFIPASAIALSGMIVTPMLVGCKPNDKKWDISSSETDCYKVEVTKNNNDGIEATITAKDPTQKFESIEVKIGQTTLREFTDYTFDVNTGKVSISKHTLQNYNGKIVITPILQEKTIQSISVNPTSLIKDVGQTIEPSDLNVTLTYDGATKTAEYNKDYKVYIQSDEIILPCSIDMRFAGGTYKLTIKSTKNDKVTADLTLKVTGRGINFESSDVSQITVTKNSNEGIETTITAKDVTQKIESIEVKIGDQKLTTESDYTFKNNILTIEKSALDSHKGDVTITTQVVDKTVNSISVNPTSLTKAVGQVIEESELNVKVEYEDGVIKEKTKYGKDYLVYLGFDEITLPCTIDTWVAGGKYDLSIKPLEKYEVTATLSVTVTGRRIRLEHGGNTQITVIKNSDDGIEATITAKDKAQKIESIEVEIGGQKLTPKSDYTFENDTLTIEKSVLDSHKGDVSITPNVVDKTVKAISVNPTSLTKDVGQKIEPSELDVKIEYEDGSFKENAQYGTDYKVYDTEDKEIDLTSYTIPISKSQQTLNWKVKSTKDNNKSAQLTITVNKLIPVEYIEIPRNWPVLRVGDRYELTATAKPENATIKKLKWTVENHSGKAKIERTDEGSFLKCEEEGDITVNAWAQDGSDIYNYQYVRIQPMLRNINLSYDEGSFKAKGITIDKDKTTAKISNETGEIQKINITYTADSDYVGFVKFFQQDGSTSVPNSMALKFSKGSGTIEFDFTSFSKIDTPQSTFKLVLMDNNFNNKPLAAVKKACDTFESKAEPSVNDAKDLCTALGVASPKAEGDTAKTILENNLVGLEGELIINDQVHTFRCIGAMHDEMVDDKGEKTGKKAALTFDLVTLLSDSSGVHMYSNWDISNNYDYTNSALRANLTGQGSGQIKWFETDHITVRDEKRSVLQMLPTELSNIIQTVVKPTSINPTKTEGKDKYVDATYNDKLFPLTYTEMAQTGGKYVRTEGEAYKYWQNHNTDADRRKTSVNGHRCHYWLASTDPINNTYVILVNDWGEVTASDVDYAIAVSFAFCI